MNLLSLAHIIERYHHSLIHRYGEQLSNEQHWALQCIHDCRCPRFGETQWACLPCQQTLSTCHSCGHRSCPRCQHHETERWLARQQQKLIPVNYFMVTFTIPFQLRELFFYHQKVLYNVLFDCAVSTLKGFAKDSQRLGGDLGLTAVLHTHSRALKFHPHVHIIVPAGCVDKAKKQWKKLKSEYLFNALALAKVFRARLLKGIGQAKLWIPKNIPKKWRVDVEKVGKGLPALTYLARYLYRGVINEKNILADDGTFITFRYKDSNTKQMITRKVKGADFIWLLLQHVLPKGFRRVRDFGFLHGNAKYLLRVIQLALGIIGIPSTLGKRPRLTCPCCGQAMLIIGFTLPQKGYG
jgi:hypothetical protein